MKSFFHHLPTSLHEALALLGPASRPLAGGTDLVTLMKPRLAEPEHLIAVRRLLPRGVQQGPEGILLGASTTLREIERHPLLNERYTALAQSAAAAASVQLRNVATIGGNLLQRPRCWYFRSPLVRCWLKGGEHCPVREGENRQHAIFGASPCTAVHPSDPAVALLAFEAYVRVAGPRGERVVALEEFFALPEDGRRTENRLAEDELILGLEMPSHPAETRSSYLKAMDRAAFSFALVSVAAVLRLSEGGKIAHARLVLGGVAPIPWRAHSAERALLGAAAGEEAFARAAEAALAGAVPLAHNGFKVPLARALVRRALRKCCSDPV
jgi:xanthine dehydrogenase YagS FAD-binding subunit